jgi:hypothetical protein
MRYTVREKVQYESDILKEYDTLDEAMKEARLRDPCFWGWVCVYETPVELDVRAYFDAQEGRVVKFWVCDGSVTLEKPSEGRCVAVYERGV